MLRDEQKEFNKMRQTQPHKKKGGSYMKKIIHYAVIAIILAAMVTPAQGVLKKTGQTGFQFLKNDMSARSAGMGGAFVMVGSGAAAMFGNPAGLAYVQSGFDVFATYTPWIADINYQGAGLVVGLGNLGSVGLNFMTVDYGESMGTILAPTELGYEETGLLDWGGLSVGAAYARRLTDKFIVGVQARYAYQHLGESFLQTDTLMSKLGPITTHTVSNEENGVAYELGTIFYPGLFSSFKFGMSIKNFSPTLTYEEEAFQMPLMFTLGFAVDLFEVLGMGGNNTLLLAVDALHPRDYTERIHAGAEFGLMDMAFLRAGYKFNYDIESLSLGGGIKYSLGGIGLKIDAAYSMMEYFDDVIKFTIGASL